MSTEPEIVIRDGRVSSRWEFDRFTVTKEKYFNWPLYTDRTRWAVVLGCHYDTVRDAFNNGLLKGQKGRGRICHTRDQILEWLAPGVTKDDLGI